MSSERRRSCPKPSGLDIDRGLLILCLPALSTLSSDGTTNMNHEKITLRRLNSDIFVQKLGIWNLKSEI